MLPELRDEKDVEQKILTKEFSSADQVLDLNDTVELLKKHNLMVDRDNFITGGELLR
jgi:hypothetical protein